MTKETCQSCGHTHTGAAFGFICIGCPCPEVPVETETDCLWKCCRCCEGNAFCAALPDQHRDACVTKDHFGNWTCDAQEAGE